MARQPRHMTGFARKLRRDMTGPELVLWKAVRGGRLDGLKVRRQIPVGRYVVDFLIASETLVIELDGASHDDRGEEDRTRQAWLEDAGYRVFRLANDDIIRDLEAVLLGILETGRPTLTLFPLAGGEGGCQAG